MTSSLPINTIGFHSTWVEIDPGAIQTNIHCIRSRTNARVMAVVKANGYGHGATGVAQAALQAGATWCAVARINEALELRQNGLDCPILIFGYTPPERIAQALQNEIALTVWSEEQAQFISTISTGQGRSARLHVKVDTGMSRLGVQPEETVELLHRISGLPGIQLEGLYTHFARADEADPSTTREQLNKFQHVVAGASAANLRPPLVHACNSAATLSQPEAHFDMVRIGIAMYGLHPSEECKLPAEMRPALRWKTVLSQVKMLPKGRGVSYGHQYITSGTERIGTLPVGYADGYRRILGNVVLVNGKRAPVIGRVCMDQIMVQLASAPQARTGDEVVLLGRQDSEQISAEEIAQRWGTINYEVTCGVGARVPRIYCEN